ncbi:MAG TPA: pyridoxamine 5'-phosphate oxidase family protein [Thermoleophilaceae bacterium]|nr:pyridoxamine 5'-phosphate oxidase family protein [Thermoleophilaceae bacterium]
MSWPDEVDAVLAGDMTAALAYLTPAGGAVVTAVAPVGMRDRDAGTVTFTTSLGFGRKLERIERDPRVALAYHARDHGFASGDSFVLVQGRCRPVPPADRDWNERVLGPAAERFMGPPRRGPFWDRWLREYYEDRVPVTVDVERLVVWSSLDCSGEPAVHGASRPEGPPEPQPAPAKGTGPRLDAAKAGRGLARLPHVLLSWRGADGFPVVVTVRVAGAAPEGIRLASGAPLPAGGRRAGLLGHAYEAKLVGLRARQHTGWLEDGLYAPHTASAFRAPRNKTLLLLANGLLAKHGLRKARREGRIQGAGESRP